MAPSIPLVVRATPSTPIAPGVTPNFINPYNRGTGLVVTSILFCSLALLVITARVCTRLKIVNGLGWDDGLAIVATVSSAEELCNRSLTRFSTALLSYQNNHYRDT